MGAVFTERIPESKRIGGYLNWCASAGIITDAMVAAQATVTLLKVAITAGIIKTEQKPLGVMLNLALDRAVDMSLIPETHACTTVAGLVALTDASTTFKQGFFG